MKLVIALAIVFSAATSAADQFKTVEKDISTPNYIASISYPMLLKNSVPAFKTINASLEATLIENGCDPEFAAETQNGNDYYGRARIVGLNQKYVGLEVSTSSYCGGAHPNYGTYHLTYDAQTGAQVEMDQEVPAQNFDGDKDWDTFHKYQLELAEIIYRNLKSAKMDHTDEALVNDCIGMEDGKQTAIENIEMLFPMISGLAKDKKVILGTSPSHAATVCGFTVRVPFSEVEKYFAKNGKVAKWLK